VNALRALARGALRYMPGDFRHRFGDEILADIDAEPERFAGNFLSILKDGLAMRADDLVGDFAYAFARLRRAPLFVTIVTLTFALGIGANVAVFSALNAIVMRPLPFAHADRLVAVFKRTEHFSREGPLAPADVADLRAQIHGITSISAIQSGMATMTLNGTPTVLKGAAVTPEWFATLGAAPEVGRFFEPADARAGRHVAIVSDRVWRAYFNGDPGVVGKRLDLDGVSYEVVGVAPPQLQTPNTHPMADHLARLDYFTAVPASAMSGPRGPGGFLGAIALLNPGVSVTQVNGELAVASQRLQALYPHSNARVSYFARPLAEQFVAPFASNLWMILLAVFGILVIACANVANLIATRWAAREREVAIRRALGASTARIAAQLFIETGLLAACGGAAGVALAYAGLRMIPLTALDKLPRAEQIAIDRTTLVYALLMVCVSTVLSGLAPVLALGRAGLQLVLNSAGRGGDAARGNGLRSAFVVAEVAIALALVISAGLVVRSYVALTRTPLGIRPDGVYTARLEHISRSTTAASLMQHREQLLARIQALPGVDAAAVALNYPLADIEIFTDPQIVGRPRVRDMLTSMNFVSPQYFRALGIPLLRGRAFTEHVDSAEAAPVAIVNQAFADKYLRGADAIGQHVAISRRRNQVSYAAVVGLVANERLALQSNPFPTLYCPASQQPGMPFSVIVHAPHADAAAERKAIQSAFTAVFPQAPPPQIATFDGLMAEETQTERSAAALLAALGLVPLLLAVSGIFGVVSFSVAQRSREFGVRAALGAHAHHILADVLRRSLSVTAIGIVLGTVFAALVARTIAPKITVSPLDPLTYGIVIALVVVSATIAAIVPALRATAVDPVVALRYE
jgi:putative ABC transport system permease protein